MQGHGEIPHSVQVSVLIVLDKQLTNYSHTTQIDCMATV